MVWSASAPQGYESDKVRYEVLVYPARGGLTSAAAWAVMAAPDRHDSRDVATCSASP
ncbi:MAG: hypothetical protein IPM06_19025 [Rhizobiales bacterium]|nr:hypothetical protein [Hyphomicrobiales bacterium]